MMMSDERDLECKCLTYSWGRDEGRADQVDESVEENVHVVNTLLCQVWSWKKSE